MTTHTAPIALAPPTAAASRGVVGLVMAVGSALAFSSSGPLVKPLLEAGWSLSTALLLRMGLAGLVLSPFLVRVVLRQRGFLRRHGLTLAVFGLIPVAGCQLFFFSAMQRMPVAVALLIQFLAPILLVGWVWMRTRRAPSRLVLLGSATAIAGLLLVVDLAGARFDLLGTALALAAALCVCVYYIVSEKTGEDLPPLALASGGLLVGAGVMAIVGLTGMIPFAAPDTTVVFRGVEVAGILPILFVGAVGTSLGYALGVMAVPMVGSRVASFVGLSEVLFALMFAWLLLAEVPAPVQFAGGALILVGVVLVRLDSRAPVTAPAEPLPGGVAPDIR